MHIPVLQKEVLQYLDPQPNENFIDCTMGQGGHTLAILEKISPNGKILGIDVDPAQIENCKLKIGNFKKRIILTSGNFANLEEIVKRTKFGQVSGILFDLGLSSWHLEESARGFSFLRQEPLDMRYDSENSKFKNQNVKLTAERIINEWPEDNLERILREYGEERFSKQIARKIIEARKFRPIETTFQLKEVIKKAVPVFYQHQRIHFCTRTFQSLRIAVNDELNNLKNALPQAINVLNKGGRLVVISFHSLEDRIVKNFLKENSQKCLLTILTKKPIQPIEKEMKANPRSRSAKLRAATKI